jgi:hypothetical protein
LKRAGQFGFVDGAAVEGIEELRLGVTHAGAGGKDLWQFSNGTRIQAWGCSFE